MNKTPPIPPGALEALVQDFQRVEEVDDSAPDEPSGDDNGNAPDASIARNQEAELVHRAIARDPAAFADLYDCHVTRVYRHIYYLVNNVGEAEDLTAQTFLKAWEAIDRYKDRGAPIAAWSGSSSAATTGASVLKPIMG